MYGNIYLGHGSKLAFYFIEPSIIFPHLLGVSWITDSRGNEPARLADSDARCCADFVLGTIIDVIGLYHVRRAVGTGGRNCVHTVAKLERKCRRTSHCNLPKNSMNSVVYCSYSDNLLVAGGVGALPAPQRLSFATACTQYEGMLQFCFS